jgi:hypothetical protein
MPDVQAAPSAGAAPGQVGEFAAPPFAPAAPALPRRPPPPRVPPFPMPTVPPVLPSNVPPVPAPTSPPPDKAPPNAYPPVPLVALVPPDPRSEGWSVLLPHATGTRTRARAAVDLMMLIGKFLFEGGAGRAKDRCRSDKGLVSGEQRNAFRTPSVTACGMRHARLPPADFSASRVIDGERRFGPASSPVRAMPRGARAEPRRARRRPDCSKDTVALRRRPLDPGGAASAREAARVPPPARAACPDIS